MHALLICDDQDEQALLRFVLQRSNIAVEMVSSLEDGLTEESRAAPGLVLVAVRVSSLRSQVLHVRRGTEVPLVIVAASDDEDEICRAYYAGADLVVTRPYSARILAMQVQALLRRSARQPIGDEAWLRAGEITLEPLTRTVTVGDRPSRRLTQLEFRLLQTLIVYRGQIVPTETIVERVWGFEGAGGLELVRGLVRRLRAKVEEDPRHPRYIITEPGVGYRLQIDTQ